MSLAQIKDDDDVMWADEDIEFFKKMNTPDPSEKPAVDLKQTLA